MSDTVANAAVLERGTGTREALVALHAVRVFDGEPAAFWARYLEVLLELTRASCGVVAAQPRVDAGRS